jgi:hypothetical protein
MQNRVDLVVPMIGGTACSNRRVGASQRGQLARVEWQPTKTDSDRKGTGLRAGTGGTPNRVRTAIGRRLGSRLFLVKGRIESPTAGCKVETFDEAGGFGGTELAVHAAVFPFDAQGALVADVVEGADDLFKVDTAATWAAEIPTSARIAKVEVTAEDARFAVELGGGVLDVDVIDPIGEFAEEFDGIDALPDQVAGVEVESEFRAMADGFQGPFRGVDIEGDFGRVDFQRELDTGCLELIEDRMESIGKELIAVVDHRLGHGGKGIIQVPNARAGEAVDDFHAELLGCVGRFLQFLNGSLVDACRIPIAPNGGGQNGFVTRIDRVADGLADQVGADRMALQAETVEQIAFGFAVIGVRMGFIHLEVIAPAGELDPIVAGVLGELSHLGQRQIGPLAGEQSNGSGHRASKLQGVNGKGDNAEASPRDRGPFEAQEAVSGTARSVRPMARGPNSRGRRNPEPVTMNQAPSVG